MSAIDGLNVSRFVGLTAAVCMTVEKEKQYLIRDCFLGMQDDIANALALKVSDFLARRAAETGDWRWWARAQHHFPSPARRAGAKEFLECLRRHAPCVQSRKTTRSTLASAAFRMLRRGVGARDFVQKIRELNSMQTDPLTDANLDRLLVWTAQQHHGEAGNAG